MSTSTTPLAPHASTFPAVSPSVTSSRRTSLETPTRSSTVSSPALGPVQSSNHHGAVAATSAAQLAAARRNRAALRDFYGLKPPPASSASHEEHDENGEAEIKHSELDEEGFDAEAYVKGLLAKENLEGILKRESNLVSEIRSLDGDRKALVYDNYSKLITATDTIRKMRANMDPLTPTTSTLTPAISHIAGTAEKLAGAVKDKAVVGLDFDRESSDKKKKRIATVKWVSAAPTRYRELIESGQKAEAENDWQRVQPVLAAWVKKGVNGARTLQSSCEELLK